MEGSGVRNHAGDLIVVSIRDDQALAELALRLGKLGRKDVAHLGLVALDFAAASLGEALGRARMCLQFGHCFLDFGRAIHQRIRRSHFRTTLGTGTPWTQGGPNQYIAGENLPPSSCARDGPGVASAPYPSFLSISPAQLVRFGSRPAGTKGSPKDLRMAREIIRRQDPAPPPVAELALRLNTLCQERSAGVLMAGRGASLKIGGQRAGVLPGFGTGAEYVRKDGSARHSLAWDIRTICWVLPRFVRRAGPAGMAAAGDARVARGNAAENSGGKLFTRGLEVPGDFTAAGQVPGEPFHLAEAYAALTALLPINHQLAAQSRSIAGHGWRIARTRHRAAQRSGHPDRRPTASLGRRPLA
jgi:hypothetical protein